MALELGDKMPHFTAKDTEGQIFDSRTVIGKKPVVLYFYPKDNTSICTVQACSFRDQYEDFAALGAEVIGVSRDSTASHQKFSKQYRLPFRLLSDGDGKLRKLFGVPARFFGLIPGRVTYVADKEGFITMIFDDATGGTIHIQKALEVLKNNSTAMNLLYPLQFQPIFKDRIWGGTKLKTVLNKPITTEITGESWELSTVAGDVSVVANGVFAGQSLTQLIDAYPEALLGTEVYRRFGKQFPLLFKYLDAREDLSIQVHPNDALAKERHNSFGKTEMWYVMQADPGARLIVGFKNDSNAKEYVENLENNTLLNLLDSVAVNVGDVFFLETGTVHAIGAGLLIAEIQQTSDITYRLYDFDRVDAHGNTRELHIDLALDAINYNRVEAKKNYESVVNASNTMVDCNYFTTDIILLEGTISMHKSGTSFTVYMCTEGNFTLTENGNVYAYQKGDTVLLPALLKEYQLTGTASVLEIYIK